MRGTRLVISKGNVKHNIEVAKRHISEKTALMAVVKGNAYGHGMCDFAHCALECGADWLAVAIAEEGAELREAGINAPILVLGAYDIGQPTLCVEYGLHQAISEPQDVVLLEKAAAQTGKKAYVHIKVNTGMNRLGISSQEECSVLTEALVQSPHVIADGVFTHFHSADTPYKERTDIQLNRFLQIVEIMKKAGMSFEMIHAANSAAILRNIAVDFDAVRWGISLYGYYPSAYIANLCADDCLIPAAEWVTCVSAIHHIQPGEGVGYGEAFVAQRPTVTATLSVGYADGLPRLMSNKGYVILHEKLAPIVGYVCMDQVMVDITDIDGVQIGDEAVIIGKRGQVQQTAEDLAKLCGTISYEILTSISQRVARCWVE